jgi:Glyoxalase-like domain
VATDWGELDHIIFFCDYGAPEAQALNDLGLHEGPGNSHPGQGTSNRRFFFPSAYLELLWVDNFEDAQRPEVRPTQLWDRWQGRASGACPFGLVFRRGEGAAVAKFATWNYAPKYFPPGFAIEVVGGLPANEPLLFYLPFARPALVENTVPASLRVGAICGVNLHLPQAQELSPALSALVAAGIVGVEPAREFLLDLYHHGTATGIMDLRPRLPLRFVPAGAQPGIAN